MNAELSARRTAAAAALADFRREMDKFIDDETSATPRPDMSMLAWRLSSELGSVLQQLEAEVVVISENGHTRGQELFERWWAAMSSQGIECEPWLALPAADRQAWEAVDDGGEEATQLAAVRAVVSAFDWETGDRQYAMEQVDEIVNGRPW